MAQTNILLESGTNELEIVEFYLDEVMPGGETYTGYYGVNVAKVLEIIRMPKVTEMPQHSAPSVLGSFNLRNKVVPLIDLSRWLGKPKNKRDDSKVIVTEFNSVINAFEVSGVNRIHRLSWEQIEQPSRQVMSFSKDSVTGVVKMDNRVIFILDMEKIIGDLNPKLALREVVEYDFSETDAADVPLKALIADDSNTIRRMIQTSLEKANFEVTATINGQEAWDTLLNYKAMAAETGAELSDYLQLIVSDIEMPAMDGHTLTKRIKDDPVFKRIPVILFSSLITESLRHKGQQVGANDQVSKPDMHELADRARNLAMRYLKGEDLSVN
ncbi:MAG: chemotaxis protein [Desulfovibrionaceae bacterium]